MLGHFRQTHRESVNENLDHCSSRYRNIFYVFSICLCRYEKFETNQWIKTIELELPTFFLWALKSQQQTCRKYQISLIRPLRLRYVDGMRLCKQI